MKALSNAPNETHRANWLGEYPLPPSSSWLHFLMKKPKKQKKARRKIRKPEKASARGPFFAYDPLQHLEQEDRLALATALATGSRKQFQEHLKAQLEIAETISPLHTASLHGYGYR